METGSGKESLSEGEHCPGLQPRQGQKRLTVKYCRDALEKDWPDDLFLRLFIHSSFHSFIYSLTPSFTNPVSSLPGLGQKSK